MKRHPNLPETPPEQGPVGSAPIHYIDRELPASHGPYDASVARIPGAGRRSLDRVEVVNVSRDAEIHPLVAYACIMAWGGRNFHNYRKSLEGSNADRVIELVKYLRASAASRQADFAYVQTAAEDIPGLGISFYTKLLFFLRRTRDAYILDQWTAKSSVVLFPQLGIKLTSADLPDPATTPATYEAFCQALDSCAGPAGWGPNWKTGEEVERAIFGRRGGAWRNFLKGWFKKSDVEGQLEPQPAGNRDLPPRPPLAPPGLPAQPNPAPGGGDVIAFAEYLRVVYAANAAAGVGLPGPNGAFAAPNRLHIVSNRGVTWQFIINQNQVRAQIFFYPHGVEIYDEVVVPELVPAEMGGNHDFGEGVYGNGPALGQTRAIDLPAVLPGGWASPVGSWPLICQSAVEAMHRLFERFDAVLP